MTASDPEPPSETPESLSLLSHRFRLCLLDQLLPFDFCRPPGRGSCPVFPFMICKQPHCSVAHPESTTPLHPKTGVKLEVLLGWLSKSRSKLRCHLDSGRPFDLSEPQRLICKTRLMLSKVTWRITGRSNLQNTQPCIWLHAWEPTLSSCSALGFANQFLVQ